jgi:ADP-heptose:LPS heptosyltransferase
MINYLIRRRVKRFQEKEEAISFQDLEQARKVIFAVFSRYGDVIISLSVIKELIMKYPDKKYFLITSNQMYPYAHKLLGNHVTIISFNKRWNPIRLIKIILLLKREKIDLGFNPWSSGDESKFVISYARKFSYYSGFYGISNIYDRIRDYLQLPKDERVMPGWNLDNVENIVICPCSTKVAKSLAEGDLLKLAAQVRQKFPGGEITVALPPKEARKIRGREKVFVFRKTKAASAAFLNLLEQINLVISVDSGPLHLADKLGLRTIGIFGPTAPQSVLDPGTHVMPLRDPSLARFFCSVRCGDPRCIHRLFEWDFLDRKFRNGGEVPELHLEMEKCRLE